MSRSETNKSLQDNFLNNIVKDQELVEVNLNNGLILTGKIVKFDNFSLLLHSNNNSLIYKHAISYIIIKKKNKK